MFVTGGGEPDLGDQRSAAANPEQERRKLPRHGPGPGLDLQLGPTGVTWQLEVPAGILAAFALAKGDAVPVQEVFVGVEVGRLQVVGRRFHLVDHAVDPEVGQTEICSDVVLVLTLEILVAHAAKPVTLSPPMPHESRYRRIASGASDCLDAFYSGVPATAVTRRGRDGSGDGR